MKILFYIWSNTASQDVYDELVREGHTVIQMTETIKDYDNDATFETRLSKALEAGFDAVFSFDYFPVISKVTKIAGIRYISWVYDCPHLTLFSRTIFNSNNTIYVFDRDLFNLLRSYGCDNVFHCPLGVATNRLDKLLGAPALDTKYDYDVSFVGNLYTDAHFDKITYLPEYIKGYLGGIMESQKKLYGINFANELLTNDLLSEIKKYVNFQFSKEYIEPSFYVIADMINKKITQLERIELLNTVSESHKLSFFTGSDSKLVPKAIAGGYVDYQTKMPYIFRHSKINLNITLRTITSGIPLRALDIMAAGGFLLSNYQPELAEFFENGKDMVMFSSKEELTELINYYLTHEEERKNIALSGYKKVKELFDYEVLLPQIVE